MEDELYSLIIEYVIGRVLDDMVSAAADEVTSYKTNNYDNEILITVTILGERRTISIPVISLIKQETVSSYLEVLVKEAGPSVRSRIYALKAKIRRRS